MESVAGHLVRVDVFLTMAAEDFEDGYAEGVPARLDRAQLRAKSALSAAQHSVVVGGDPLAHIFLITTLQKLIDDLNRTIRGDGLTAARDALPQLRAQVGALLAGLGNYDVIPLPPKPEERPEPISAESLFVGPTPPARPKVGEIWVDTSRGVSVMSSDGTWVGATP